MDKLKEVETLIGRVRDAQLASYGALGRELGLFLPEESRDSDLRQLEVLRDKLRESEHPAEARGNA